MIKDILHSLTPFRWASLYYLGWCIYLLQGTLYETGSIISQLILLFLLCFSIRPIYRIYQQNECRVYFKPLTTFFAVMSIYSLTYWLSGKEYVIEASGTTIQGFGAFKQLLVSFSPIYVGYWFAKKGELTKDDLRIWIIGFLIVGICFYFSEQRKNLTAALLIGSARTEFVNNSSYFFVSLIPSLLVWKQKPIVQYFLLSVCLTFVLMSMKRGPILCCIPCLYIFFKDTFNNSSPIRKITIFIIIVTVLLGLIYFIQYMESSSELFLQRIIDTKAGKSSRRDEIYSNLLSYAYSRQNPFYWLFGEGANSTLLHSENFAHNDWIELFVNNGLVGLILYVQYWKGFYKVRAKGGCENIERRILSCFFIMFLLTTFFSMSYSALPVFGTLPMGYYIYKVYAKDNK